MQSLSWKKRFILLGVSFSFSIGILAALPNHLYLRQYLDRIPLLSQLLNYYEVSGFQQHWYMFAPPPEDISTLKYSAITTTGWGPLTEPFAEMAERMQKAFVFLPPGLIRPMALLRYFMFDNQLDKFRFRKFLFYQLSNYYCFGDGKIPGLLKIRFYIEKKGIPLFYLNNEFGNPLPSASQRDGVILLYERDCSER